MRIRLVPFYVTEIKRKPSQGIEVRHFDFADRLRERAGAPKEYSPNDAIISYMNGADFTKFDHFKRVASLFGYAHFFETALNVTIEEFQEMRGTLAYQTFGELKKLLGSELYNHAFKGLEDTLGPLPEGATLLNLLFVILIIQQDSDEPHTKEAFTEITEQIMELLYEIFLKRQFFDLRDDLQRFCDESRRGAGMTPFERISYCFEKAVKYGVELKISDQGDVILTGRTFPSCFFLFLAQRLSEGRVIPPPSNLVCRVCGKDIEPSEYRSLYYCSIDCSKKGSKPKSSALKLANMVRNKAKRHLDAERYAAFKVDLKSELARNQTEDTVKEICKKYGIDPNPGKPGRPPTRAKKALAEENQ